MIDGGLRALFHKHLKKFGAHCQAIETSTGLGVPDSNICLNGVEFWIEHKKCSANAVRLSIEQSAWITQRVRCGGKVFIAVRKKRNTSKRLTAIDELWLIPGVQAMGLREQGLKATMPLAIWQGGPANWPWDEIKRILIDG